jgi:tryptophanyl-tRNA synthetase
MGAVTDTGTTIVFDETRPALANLLTIFSLITKQEISSIEAAYVGKGYADFKRGLADAMITFLQPIQTNINNYLKQEDELKRILDKGAEQASEIAEKKMKIVRERIGVRV